MIIAHQKATLIHPDGTAPDHYEMIAHRFDSDAFVTMYKNNLSHSPCNWTPAEQTGARLMLESAIANHNPPAVGPQWNDLPDTTLTA